ncbi:hypothetical protein D3C75_810950 [compost metagenome]
MLITAPLAAGAAEAAVLAPGEAEGAVELFPSSDDVVVQPAATPSAITEDSVAANNFFVCIVTLPNILNTFFMVKVQLTPSSDESHTISPTP